MIERLYVHNYRCFENFTLDLKGLGSALVIGKNGSGKSTLRHALGILQNVGRGTGRVRDWLDVSDFTRNRTDIPIRFEITVTLNNRRIAFALSFEFSEQYRDVRVAEESLSVDGTPVFTRLGSRVEVVGGGGFVFDTPVPLLQVVNFQQITPASQQLKQFFASIVLLAPVPSSMSGYAEEGSFEVRPDASNFGAWLNALLLRYPARYAEVSKYLQAVVPDFASFEFIERGERGRQLRVHFEPPGILGSPLTLDFGKLSDGEKCFFLSAAIVAFNRPENPVFCFWDEPDNHLSLPEVGHFITELRRMSNQNGQFIATSHHPETIRRFSDENTFVFTRNSHLEPTVVRPLSDSPYGGDLVRALTRGEVL